jgi:hypothetical protein
MEFLITDAAMRVDNCVHAIYYLPILNDPLRQRRRITFNMVVIDLTRQSG